MDGSKLKDAQAVQILDRSDELCRPYHFNTEGANEFADITRNISVKT
jgi:hypothetical protein